MKSAPSNLSNCRILWLKKNASSCNQKIRYLGMFGVDLWKAIVIFEMTTLKFVKLQYLTIKTKILGFKINNLLLGIFEQDCFIWLFKVQNFLKNYSHIWNQHCEFCQIAKFCRKPKRLRFVTKVALFGLMWVRILKIIVLYENQHPQISQIGKFYVNKIA